MFKSAFSYSVPVLEHVTLGARDLAVCGHLPADVNPADTAYSSFSRKENLPNIKWVTQLPSARSHPVTVCQGSDMASLGKRDSLRTFLLLHILQFIPKKYWGYVSNLVWFESILSKIPQSGCDDIWSQIVTSRIFKSRLSMSLLLSHGSMPMAQHGFDSFKVPFRTNNKWRQVAVRKHWQLLLISSPFAKAMHKV